MNAYLRWIGEFGFSSKVNFGIPMKFNRSTLRNSYWEYLVSFQRSPLDIPMPNCNFWWGNSSVGNSGKRCHFSSQYLILFALQNFLEQTQQAKNSEKRCHFSLRYLVSSALQNIFATKKWDIIILSCGQILCIFWITPSKDSIKKKLTWFSAASKYP